MREQELKPQSLSGFKAQCLDWHLLKACSVLGTMQSAFYFMSYKTVSFPGLLGELSVWRRSTWPLCRWSPKILRPTVCSRVLYEVALQKAVASYRWMLGEIALRVRKHCGRQLGLQLILRRRYKTRSWWFKGEARQGEDQLHYYSQEDWEVDQRTWGEPEHSLLVVGPRAETFKDKGDQRQ